VAVLHGTALRPQWRASRADGCGGDHRAVPSLDESAAARSYFELGFTSPAITKFVEAINRLLGENLSPSVLFDYRDIGSLAAFLATTYSHKIAPVTVVRQGPTKAAEQQRKLTTLVPLPRKTYFSNRPAPEQSNVKTESEQVLEEMLWQEASLDDSYEKVTL
jgi:hypothetical protein